MFPPATQGVTSAALPSDIGSVLQRMAVALLGLVALACAHAMLYHLHYILAPFILSGFLVFALEPSVQKIYKSLAGLDERKRWCCCCMRRRWRSRRLQQGDASSEASEEESADSEDHQEAQILLGDQAGADWEGYTIRVMDGVCRLIAVILVLGGVLLIALFLIYLLASGAMQIKDNWLAYQKGAESWVSWLDDLRNAIITRLKLSKAMDSRVKMVYTNVLARFQELILQLVNMIVAFVTGGVSFAVIVLMYMLFWLFQPLPISGKASTLVQSYILTKTLVAFLYGTSVASLLFCLGVDLPTFFGLVSFCLYFVPEVGAFISMLAPVPLILLNGNLDHPISVLMVALIGQVLLKLLIGNFLELRLVSKDDEMSLHPVWVLLSLNYFGFLWGPVGMLISVPLLATLKSILISKEEELKEQQPFLADCAGNVLACLEGRKRRDDRRRRSTWLLPFATPAAPQKEMPQESAAENRPQPEEADVPQSDPVSKEEVSEEPAASMATGPKKTRQPESLKASQPEEGGAQPEVGSAADIEEQKLTQPPA